MCHTTLTQHFDLAILFDLTLTLVFTWYKTHTFMIPSSSLGTSFGKVCVSSCYSPVSVADEAKWRFWHLAWHWPDMWPCKKINVQKCTHWELSTAASLRPPVRELGGGGGGGRICPSSEGRVRPNTSGSRARVNDQIFILNCANLNPWLM